MKYTVEDLTKENKDWKKENFIFFWKIRKGKEVNKSCLSQWYPSEFIIKGRRYNCAEQFMMAQKALLFEDEEIYKKIIVSTDPKEIKSLGRKVKGFDPVKWEEEKYRIVREGNFAKFTQSQELRDYLVSTESKILVEASLYDYVWGIGMKESNSDILDPSKWKGQNLLGFILMDIRDEIIERIPEPEIFEWEEEFTDDITGEIVVFQRQKRNEKYLPKAQKIWDQMLYEESESLKQEKDKLEFEKIENNRISDKLKKFLITEYQKRKGLTEDEINHKIEKYKRWTYSELLEEMMEDPDYSFDIYSEWNVIGYDNVPEGWYAFIGEHHYAIEIGPYQTIKEAIECATIGAIKNIYFLYHTFPSKIIQYKPEELK